ncbi:hypothetical protein AB0C07_12915 [Actinoplanes missouriensis]|uniref:hypothetical protein n=1 Tax=Actinoplanes missouriensis TaxID=1866 RepID=UPI0033CFAFE1
MSWVERIAEVTRARPDRRDIAWAPVDAELGAAVPSDFRELCALFGDRYFNGFLRLMSPTAEDGVLYWFRTHRRNSRYDHLYAPYEMYRGPDQPGLLRWGDDMTEGEYYWLADARVDPGRWPVVARRDGLEPWHRYEIGVAEFLHRMLTDDGFTPFTVAGTASRSFVLPEGVMITSAEEWNFWAGGDSSTGG